MLSITVDSLPFLFNVYNKLQLKNQPSNMYNVLF